MRFKILKTKNIIFILAISFLFPMLIFLKEPGYHPYSISEMLILTVILFFTIILMKKDVQYKIPLLYSFVILIYVAYQFILLFGSSSYLAAFSSILLHDKYILLSILVFHFINKDNENVFIVTIIIVAIAAVYLALVKILQNPMQLLTLFGSGGYSRSSSVFPNSNMFGVYMLVVGFLELYVIDLLKNKKQQILFFVFFFLPTILALLLTFSRRAWGLFMMGLIVYYLFRKGKKTFYIISGIVIVTFVLNFIDYESIISRFMLIFDSNYESNNARTEAFYEQYKTVTENIFTVFGGNGIGMVGPNSIFTDIPKWTRIDNYYIMLLMEFGFIGFFIYVSIFFIINFYALKLLKVRSIDNILYNKILIYLIILFSLYLSGIVGVTPISFPLNMLQWTIVGLILYNYRTHYKDKYEKI